MKEYINYETLKKINSKANEVQNSWDDCVEKIYTSYLISIIDGSFDEKDLNSVVIEKSSYEEGYNFFYNSIDNSLEELIDNIDIYNKNELNK